MAGSFSHTIWTSGRFSRLTRRAVQVSCRSAPKTYSHRPSAMPCFERFGALNRTSKKALSLPWIRFATASGSCRFDPVLLETFSDDPVRSLHALLLQEVKPDGVDIEDGIFGKPKRVGIVSLDSPS